MNGKKLASFKLTAEARELLIELARVKGLNKTAVLESLIRSEAKAEGLKNQTRREASEAA
jgi:hypothetical protein